MSTTPSSMTPAPEAPTLLARHQVQPYLLATLRWAAINWRARPELLEAGVACYGYLAGRFYDRGQRGFTHLPLSLIVDLMAIIELGDRAPFVSQDRSQRWPQEERRLRLDYENLLLGALLQEPSFVEARERLPHKSVVRAGARQRLAELLLQTFGRYYPRQVQINPAHLRDLTPPAPGDIDPQAALTELGEELGRPWLLPEATRQMLHGISNEVYWRELLRSEDLFEIEHWAVLDTEARRIGSRQISEVERRLGEFRLPRVRLRDEAMEVETDFDDDTVYPTGGFAGLATRGSFENLVRSELVYMGEGSPVSLFDLRFVESELLFYMRNDGVMRRKRRFIHVILDLHDAFYYKAPGYEYPFSTLIQGLVVRLTRDLLETFEEDAVTVHIHYVWGREGEPVPEDERERAARERDLLALVLGREIRQERARVELTESLGLESIQHGRGRIYALTMTFASSSENLWRDLFEDLEHARPPVLGLTLPVATDQPDPRAYESSTPLVLPLSGLTLPQIAEIKNELFAQIVGGRR